MLVVPPPPKPPAEPPPNTAAIALLRSLNADPTDWRALADALYLVARSAGCRCEYARNTAGVPLWFPNDAGGIGRKLIKRCSRCVAKEAYEAAAGIEVSA